jgi:tetratricopeptide (TPR) repeat protein
MGQAGSQGYTHHASVDDPQHAGTYFQCGLDAPAHRRVPSIVTWGARMNPWISRNSLSSRIAAASLVGLVILAPTSGASDQNLGIVSFANSGSPAVQADFLTGLAQLHNFQYPQAAQAFQRAESLDPNFAMAYWGEAMTYNHAVWQQQDLPAARAVLAKLGATPEARAAKAATPREKAYLHAVEILYGEGDKYERDRRYALTMEQLHASYPDDVDATCFYALALLGTSHAGRDVPTYMRAAALMEEAFEQNPRHPGAAHYLIHSVDDSVHAPLGLRAARAYSKIAPDSPHAQHMTSHIFLALGMWDEVVAANEATMRIIDSGMQARNKAAPRIGCAHPITWLAYGYLQQGRLADARRLVENCGEEMRNRTETATGADLLDYDNTSAGSFSAMRTRYLIDSGDWSGAINGLKVNVAGVVVAEFTRDFADAYRAARYGKTDTAVAAVKRAKDPSERLVAAAIAAGIPAESPMRRVPMIAQDELNGLLLLRQGQTASGLALLTRAAAAEKDIPMEFGPPSLDKPANELLGEVLLDHGRAQEARAAFEAAQILAPGRGQSLIGLSECARVLKDTELAQSVDARLGKVGLREALSGKGK